MIKFGQIVNIIKPADNGIYGAQVCKVYIKELDYEVTAYTKQLSEQDLLVEIMAALIGRTIGLNIPEPIMAASIDQQEIHFGSVALQFPDLTHTIELQNGKPTNTPANMAMFKKLSEWQQMNHALTFDEWIANSDRNLGNVLYDGKDNFHLIDHNQAMRPAFTVDAPVNNQLMNVKMLFTQDELSKQRLKNAIQVIVNEVNTGVPTHISSLLTKTYPSLKDDNLDNMVQFLENRLTHLFNISEQKILPRQMSL